ncbi:hypothetical protein HDV02_006384 [Globomyces sp. JEL0801]|nr:hypothetical protein HDV02_006384 [Globomyces sp. JEL0801]
MTSKELVLTALADTFVATLTNSEINDSLKEYSNFIADDIQLTDDTLKLYLNYQPSDMKGIGIKMSEYMDAAIPKDKLSQINIFLSTLNTSIGTYMIGGYYKPFPKLSRNERETVVKKLKNSWIKDLRLLFKVFYTITTLFSYGCVGDAEVYKSWKSFKYSGSTPESKRVEAHQVWKPEFINLDNATDDVEIHCDVVVVGSGAGGGVMAAELSEAGYKVILVEKSSYVHPSDFSSNEFEALSNNMERKCGLYSEDGSIFLLAGVAWGGGTAVNWSACLEPPQSLREEWAIQYGLEHFVTKDFQNSVDIISKRIGVGSDKIKHNNSNQILFDGCKKLGYDVKVIPQNTANQEHECGWCSFGCPYAVKQTSALTWIQDAAKHGCEFIDGFEVTKVLHSNGIATGVIGKKGNKTITIRSSKVVLSCGSMNTPAVLLRSKIPNLNKHVGKHLRLHPVGLVSGVFPDRDIKQFRGSIMTVVSNQVADLDGKGYGAKLEVPISHPICFGVVQKWESAAQHKQRMVMLPHTSSVIVLTRDKDSEGQIWVDDTGMMRFDWQYGKFDQNSVLKGFEAGVKIMIAEGAKEIYTSQNGLASFKPDPSLTVDEILASKELKDFLNALYANGANQGTLGLFAAHQMGTCRMAADPRQGAVNPRGESYDLKGLYISDTSVFPTASGVK